MESDSRAIALAFAGMLVAGFAVLFALLSADGVAAIGFLVATVFCAAEFISRLDFDVVSES